MIFDTWRINRGLLQKCAHHHTPICTVSLVRACVYACLCIILDLWCFRYLYGERVGSSKWILRPLLGSGSESLSVFMRMSMSI